MAARSGSGLATTASSSSGLETPFFTPWPDLDGLHPLIADRAQPQRDAARPQAMVGRVEVDRTQGARDGLADGQVLQRRVGTDTLQLLRCELELQLELLARNATHPATLCSGNDLWAGKPPRSARIPRISPRLQHSRERPARERGAPPGRLGRPGLDARAAADGAGAPVACLAAIRREEGPGAGRSARRARINSWHGSKQVLRANPTFGATPRQP